MEDEMTIIVFLPLVEGSSSSMIVAPLLVQLPTIVKWCHKKKNNK
jgi:hypothetical protein